MKRLVDAQLPKRLTGYLRQQGDDALHMLDLPNSNATTDEDICVLSLQEERIVVSKDSDFVRSYFVGQTPYKLLFISVGNISNNDLLRLVEANYLTLRTLFEHHNLVELERFSLIIRA